MVDRWKLEESKEVFKCPVFNVQQKAYLKPENKGPFKAYVLDVPDWVNIIAANEEGNVILIRQYRFGTDKIELEIPGGIIERGEAPRSAALRELKEETGYIATSIEQIGVVSANPAIMNNRCYSFFARFEDREKGEVQFDPDEMIETEFASIDQIRKYLKEGKISNAYVIAAFLWLLLRKDIFASKIQR